MIGIVGNSIAQNTADYAGGGGIYCTGGSVTISGNTIRKNRIEQSSSRGGGIYCLACSASIHSNTIIDNQGEWGGAGIQFRKATAGVFGNVIAGNHAHWEDGGGIACEESTVTITNNTIVHNYAGDKGGGIYSYSSSVTVANCILWSNGDDLYGCQATYSCVQNLDPGQGNIHQDPLFANISLGDFHLLPTSPCIDSGNDLSCEIPATDMDGEYRPFGPAVDIGADEFVDQDGDDLPDYWEIASFGQLWFGPDDDPDDDSLRNADELLQRSQANNPDSDADGQNDGEELAAGEDPLNPESFFRVTSIRTDGEATIIEFSSVPGRTYRLFSSPDLREWNPVGNYTVAYRIAATLAHVVRDSSRCFYRVQVLP